MELTDSITTLVIATAKALKGRAHRLFMARTISGAGSICRWRARLTISQPRYGPPTSPQPQRGIGVDGSAGLAPGSEFITAMRDPHSR